MSIDYDIFEGVISQYIDHHGKCRMLTYDDGVSLMTSPLPPIDMKVTDEYSTTTFQVAINFIRKKNLILSELDGIPETGVIQGLWVRPRSINGGIEYGYIPVEIEDVSKSIRDLQGSNSLGDLNLQNITFSSLTINDPMRTNTSSELKEFLFYKKLTSYLLQFTYLEYSLNPKKFDNPNDVYIVIPEHSYNFNSQTATDNIFPRTLEIGDPRFYSNGRLIVPSEDIKERLVYNLQIQLLNNPIPIVNFALDNRVRNKYQSIFDFRKAQHQLIFMSRESLVEWKNQEKNDEHILQLKLAPPEETQPYFYQNSEINAGRPVIIQNNEGGIIQDAITISRMWTRSRINIGNDFDLATGTNEGFTYRIYEESKGFDFEDGEGMLIQYPDGRCGSILPL